MFDQVLHCHLLISGSTLIGGNNYIDLIWQIHVIINNNFNLANNIMALIGKLDVVLHYVCMTFPIPTALLIIS